MKIVLLDAKTLGDDIPLSAFSQLGDFTAYPKTSPDDAPERIKDADVIITNKVKLTGEILCHAPSLSLICVTATGYDNVDIGYCKNAGVAVCNVKGYSTECVAQLTISMALSLTNHLRVFDDYVKSGEYSKSGIQNKLTPTFNEVYGKTWGIVGLGNIGKRVADIAKVMGCRILAYKRTPVEDYECVDLETLIKNSDIISVHIPSSPETVGLIDKKMLSLMKERAILVNVARGNILDEEAVAEAILDGSLYGFGCDVYSTEPFPENHPYSRLSGCDNVILTPHMAWGGYETRVRLVSEVAENIRAFYNGQERNRII
ncbi:MAG: hydroxyacid dehydrogenase [Clostridia bacterium]|nr:hydroxyacid dehydrogenase [Clostridia bacterium]